MQPCERRGSLIGHASAQARRFEDVHSRPKPEHDKAGIVLSLELDTEGDPPLGVGRSPLDGRCATPCPDAFGRAGLETQRRDIALSVAELVGG